MLDVMFVTIKYTLFSGMIVSCLYMTDTDCFPLNKHLE